MSPISFATPIKIWYKPLPSIPKISWPIIDIHISYRGNELPQPIFALVDSGASHSILHPEIVEALGVNLKKLGKPELVGTSVSGHYRSWALPDTALVTIYGYEFDFKFEVIENPSLSWPCILGADTIFHVAGIDFQEFKSFFKIRFRQDIH